MLTPVESRCLMFPFSLCSVRTCLSRKLFLFLAPTRCMLLSDQESVPRGPLVVRNFRKLIKLLPYRYDNRYTIPSSCYYFRPPTLYDCNKMRHLHGALIVVRYWLCFLNQAWEWASAWDNITQVWACRASRLNRLPPELRFSRVCC